MASAPIRLQHRRPRHPGLSLAAGGWVCCCLAASVVAASARAEPATPDLPAPPVATVQSQPAAATAAAMPTPLPPAPPVKRPKRGAAYAAPGTQLIPPMPPSVRGSPPPTQQSLPLDTGAPPTSDAQAEPAPVGPSGADSDVNG
jgi:hypothetical protein